MEVTVEQNLLKKGEIIYENTTCQDWSTWMGLGMEYKEAGIRLVDTSESLDNLYCMIVSKIKNEVRRMTLKEKFRCFILNAPIKKIEKDLLVSKILSEGIFAECAAQNLKDFVRENPSADIDILVPLYKVLDIIENIDSSIS